MTAAIEDRFTDSWWLNLLQGIAVLMLGILLIVVPGITVATLVVFLGIYWLIVNIFRNGGEAEAVWETLDRGDVYQISLPVRQVLAEWDED